MVMVLDIKSQVTQVSGATTVCEGIGIVIIKIPKTDITLLLFLKNVARAEVDSPRSRIIKISNST